MRTLPLFLIACAALAVASVARGEGCVDVEVRNVRARQGQLMVNAFVDAESFGRKPAASLRLPAGDSTMRFQVCGLAGGTVALVLFQDLDGDGRLARNLIGMPSEPWGTSGAPGMFGPKWETARVATDGKPVVVLLSQ